MKIPDHAQCFKSKNGPEMFIYTPGAQDLYYSPDGIQFFQLEALNFDGTAQDCTISFEDPHHNYKGKLTRDQGTVLWDGKIFKITVAMPAEIDVILLSTLSIREAIYLFRLTDGVYIYVSRSKYQDTKSYNSYKMFMGNTNQMMEIPIQRVERLRDGGTTNIYTGQGKLYRPTPHNKKAKPTWDGEPMEKLDPKNYTIIEDGNKVRISMK